MLEIFELRFSSYELYKENKVLILLFKEILERQNICRQLPNIKYPMQTVER